MKPFAISYVAWLGLICLAAAPLAKGDGWDKRTAVTFHQPVEIPQHVLGPGTYVMKLVDLDSTRDVVQFLNKRENRVIATVFAVPAYDPGVNHDRTFFTYEERAANAPPAIKTWYYPGDSWGEEFIYPKVEQVSQQPPTTNFAPRPERPSAAPPSSVVEPAPQRAPASAPVIAQNTAPAAPPEARPEPAKPVEIAQASPPPAAAPAKELPKTASDLPFIALLGGLATACGLVLRTCSQIA